MQMFGGKPKVDQSLIKATQQREEQAAQEKKQLQTEQNAKLRSGLSRNSGQRSLLSGLETGVNRKVMG